MSGRESPPPNPKTDAEGFMFDSDGRRITLCGLPIRVTDELAAGYAARAVADAIDRYVLIGTEPPTNEPPVCQACSDPDCPGCVQGPAPVETNAAKAQRERSSWEKWQDAEKKRGRGCC